jgi:hypothetical protein
MLQLAEDERLVRPPAAGRLITGADPPPSPEINVDELTCCVPEIKRRLSRMGYVLQA